MTDTSVHLRSVVTLVQKGQIMAAKKTDTPNVVSAVTKKGIRVTFSEDDANLYRSKGYSIEGPADGDSGGSSSAPAKVAPAKAAPTPTK